MPKPSLLDEVKRNFDCAFYRWEFIRRSKLYLRDFDLFFAEFGDWLEKHNFDLRKLPQVDSRYWASVEKSLAGDLDAKHFFGEYIARYRFGFRLKWGLDFPLHPSYTFDPNNFDYIVKNGIPLLLPLDERIDLSISVRELATTARESARIKMAEHFDKLKDRPRDTTPYEISVYTPIGMGRPGKYELFSFNETQWQEFKELAKEFPARIRGLGISSVLSLGPEADELLFHGINSLIEFLDRNRQMVVWPIVPEFGKGAHVQEFRQILKVVKFRNMKSGMTPLNQRLPNSRVPIKKFGEYLSVWDIKTSEPELSNLEVAQRLFGDTYPKDSDPEAPTRRVLRAFAQAEEYIRGKFRQIR